MTYSKKAIKAYHMCENLGSLALPKGLAVHSDSKSWISFRNWTMSDSGSTIL